MKLRRFWQRLRRAWAYFQQDLEPDWNHDYAILIRRLQPEEGGGFMACIPQCGWATLVGDGETPEEALSHLQEIYEHLGPDTERIVQERYAKRFPDLPWVPYDEDAIGAMIHFAPELLNEFHRQAKLPASDPERKARLLRRLELAMAEG